MTANPEPVNAMTTPLVTVTPEPAILAGEAHFTLDGEEHVAGPGQTIVVPAGVPHSAGNPGPTEIDGIVELRPALHTKELHEAFAGLVADGKTTPRGAPKNPLQLGATF